MFMLRIMNIKEVIVTYHYLIQGWQFSDVRKASVMKCKALLK